MSGPKPKFLNGLGRQPALLYYRLAAGAAARGQPRRALRSAKAAPHRATLRLVASSADQGFWPKCEVQRRSSIVASWGMNGHSIAAIRGRT